MKKIFILLITAFLLTGCNSTYEININKENINDKITIMTSSKNVQNANKTTTDLFTQKLGEWENGHDFYQREIVTTDKETGYQYTYSFNYNEYDAMSQIRKCYNDFNLKYDKYISLSTSSEFLCKNYYPQVKTYTIKITSEYEIANSNADSVKDNTHTWHINSNNYKNKPINIQINKDKKYTPKKENTGETIKGIIIILIFIGLVIFFIKFKKGINK